MHAGIYVGNDRVIHFSRTSDEGDRSSSLFSSSSESTRPPCQICGYDKRKHKGVIKTCLDCFSRGHGLSLFNYGVSSSRCFLDRAGACSTGGCDAPFAVVQRAEDLLIAGTSQTGEYELLENNCECFAFYCKTEIWNFSSQVVYVQSLLNVAGDAFRPKNIVNPFMWPTSLAKLAIVPSMDVVKRDKMFHRQQNCK